MDDEDDEDRALAKQAADTAAGIAGHLQLSHDPSGSYMTMTWVRDDETRHVCCDCKKDNAYTPLHDPDVDQITAWICELCLSKKTTPDMQAVLWNGLRDDNNRDNECNRVCVDCETTNATMPVYYDHDISNQVGWICDACLYELHKALHTTL